MSSQDFPLFPNFPSEIRDLIWIAATTPRIVYVWANNDPANNPRHRGYIGRFPSNLPPPKWLQSSSPIPTSLHTCRESRQALQRYGYQLAFGLDYEGYKSEPRTWFNFSCDALYLDLGALQNPCNNHRRSWPPKHYIQYCSQTEQKRVKNLALFSNTAWKGIFDVFDHTHPIDNFENVENLLLVEHHTGNSSVFFDFDRKVRSDRDKALLFLEHDAAEGISRHLDPELSDYLPWYTRVDGYRGFKRTRKVPPCRFRDIERDFEMKLMANRDVWTCRTGEVPNTDYTAKAVRPYPKVRLGAIFTESKAERVVKIREAYWNGIMDMEAVEAQIGPPGVEFRSLDGIPVPFTEEPDAIWERHFDEEEEKNKEILEWYDERVARAAQQDAIIRMTMKMESEAIAAVEEEYGPPELVSKALFGTRVSWTEVPNVIWENYLDAEEEEDKGILQESYEAEAQRDAMMETGMQAEDRAAAAAEYGPPTREWTAFSLGAIPLGFELNILGESGINDEDEEMFAEMHDMPIF